MNKEAFVSYIKSSPERLAAYKSKSTEERKIVFDKFQSASTSAPKNSEIKASKYDENVKKVNALIKERGTVYDIAKKANALAMRGGLTNDIMSGLEIASIPMKVGEAAIANPMLNVQQGPLGKSIGKSIGSAMPLVKGARNAGDGSIQQGTIKMPVTNPAMIAGRMVGESGALKEIPREVMAGLKGEKLGEFGDVGRVAGYPEWVSSSMGLAASMLSPIAILTRGVRGLNRISLATDKGIQVAGKQLMSGADDAIRIVGRDLDDVYAGINSFSIKGSENIVKALDNLPNVVRRNLFRELNIKGAEELVENLDIAKVRKIKGLLGKAKPGAFKEIASGLDIEKTKNAYKVLAQSIQKTLISEGDEYAKIAGVLSDADDAFTATRRAADYIKKGIIDSTLQAPTKAGNVARGLKKEGDMTTRVALKTLRKAGGSARRNINKSIAALNKYNRIISTSKVLKGAMKSALFAGLVGSIGAKTARAVLNTDDMR